MGLTIHHSIQAETNKVKEIKALLNQIRQRAMDLPFHSVGELVELKGDDCDFEKNNDENVRWFLIGAQAYVEIKRMPYGSRSIGLPPKRVIGFEILVGDGCEPLEIRLAAYPKTVKYGNRTFRTGKTGWSGRGFCKTQYASHPECGGVQHFLRCHIACITLLEFAQSLPGLKVEINDEGKYGTSNYTDDPGVLEPVYYMHDAQHDVEELAREIGEWNEMIAGMAGALKDAMGPKGVEVVSPITERPDFEQLEAKGVAAHPEIRTNLGLNA